MGTDSTVTQQASPQAEFIRKTIVAAAAVKELAMAKGITAVPQSFTFDGL